MVGKHLKRWPCSVTIPPDQWYVAEYGRLIDVPSERSSQSGREMTDVLMFLRTKAMTKCGDDRLVAGPSDRTAPVYPITMGLLPVDWAEAFR